MNCDQAFDAMTDPQRAASSALFSHMSVCPRCRQMYETLEPALGLFTPSDSAATLEMETTSSPVSEASLRLAQQVAGRLTLPANPSPPPSPPSPHISLRRQLLAAVTGVVAAGLMMSIGWNFSNAPGVNTPPARSEECAWLNRTSSTERESANSVVLACVSCHLGRSPHAELRDEVNSHGFSTNLDRLMFSWKLRSSSIGDQFLIADLAQRDARHAS